VIHTMGANGGNIASTGVQGRNPRWFPDRTLLTFWNSDGVFTMRPDGHAIRLILESMRGSTFFHTWEHPSWSRDGDLVVTVHDADLESPDRPELDVVMGTGDAPGDGCAGLSRWNSQLGRWSPDANMLAVVSLGGQLCLTDDVSGPRLLEVFADDVAWSPAGDRLAVSGALQIVDLDGNLIRDLGVEAQSVDWQPVCTLQGTPRDDLLVGTAGDDVICGLGGDDTIRAGAGADTVYGGSGDDYLAGEDDDDVLYGGFNEDRLFGNSGDDLLNGGPAADVRCHGGSGTNSFFDCEVIA
jgi:hypothetical protein